MKPSNFIRHLGSAWEPRFPQPNMLMYFSRHITHQSYIFLMKEFKHLLANIVFHNFNFFKALFKPKLAAFCQISEIDFNSNHLKMADSFIFISLWLSLFLCENIGFFRRK